MNLIDISVVNRVLYIKAFERFKTDEDLQIFLSSEMITKITNESKSDIHSLFE